MSSFIYRLSYCIRRLHNTTWSLGTSEPQPLVDDEYLHQIKRWCPSELPTGPGFKCALYGNNTSACISAFQIETRYECVKIRTNQQNQIKPKSDDFIAQLLGQLLETRLFYTLVEHRFVFRFGRVYIFLFSDVATYVIKNFYIGLALIVTAEKKIIECKGWPEVPLRNPMGSHNFGNISKYILKFVW